MSITIQSQAVVVNLCQASRQLWKCYVVTGAGVVPVFTSSPIKGVELLACGMVSVVFIDSSRVWSCRCVEWE
jgi:hypothetical protein